MPVNEDVAKQVDAYRALTRMPVALLAKRSELPGASARRWEGIPRGSWEGLVERLRDANQQLDPDAIPRLRQDFIELAEAFQVGGELPLTDAAVKRAVAARQQLAEWPRVVEPLLRRLLPELPATTKDSWVWSEDGPLDGAWQRKNAPQGFGASGLGLRGEPQRVGDHSVVVWFVWIYPSSKTEAEHRHLLDEGWDETEYGWWTLELGSTFDPDETGREVLERLLADLHTAVTGELGIPLLPTPTLPTKPILDMPVLAHSQALELTQVASDRLRQVVDGFYPAMLHALGKYFPGNVRLSRRGRRRVFLNALTSNPREFAALLKLDGKGAFVGIWCWLGGKRAHDAVEPSLAAWCTDLGVSWKRSETADRHFDLMIPALPVATLKDRLQTVIEQMAQWAWDERHTIGARVHGESG